MFTASSRPRLKVCLAQFQTQYWYLLPRNVENSLKSAAPFASHKWLQSMQVFHISVTNARSEFDKLLVYCGAACRLGCLSAAAYTQHLRWMPTNECELPRIAQEVSSSCAMLPRSIQPFHARHVRITPVHVFHPSGFKTLGLPNMLGILSQITNSVRRAQTSNNQGPNSQTILRLS